MAKDPDNIKSPRFEPQCKLCQWSKGAADSREYDLYKFVRDQAIQGTPYGTISNNTKEYIAKLEISDKFKPPMRKSVWRHFEKHSPLQTLAEIHAAREDWVPKDKNPLVDERILSGISKETFDEYDELCRLYTHFSEIRNKIYEYDSSLKIGVPNGGEAWSQNKIQTYVSMVNTQKSILAEISKMRQGDKLIAVAAKFVIESFTRNLIGKLKSEFDAFASIMRRQNVSDEVVEAFEEVTSHRIATLFVDEAGVAMDLTKREFKLPN